MKKMSTVFTILIASLLFYVSWNTFNMNYFQRQNSFNVNSLKNSSVDRLELHLSTHVLEIGTDELKETFIDFFKEHNMDGYIAFEVVEDNLDKSTHYYLHADYDLSLFEFFTLPKKLNIDFKSLQENNYITNDLSKNAYHIDYLDTNYYKSRDDYDRSNITIYPLSKLNDLENEYMKNIQTTLVVFAPQNQEANVNKMLLEDIYIPLGLTSKALSDDILFELSNNTTENSIQLVDASSLESIVTQNSITEMPNSLLLISVVALLLVNVYLIFAQAKEIYIRRMHGNSNLLIFAKTVLRVILTSLFVFFLTFVGLWIIYVHSYREIALLFSKQLLYIFLMYALFVSISIIVLYLYLSIKNSILFLKKKLDLSITLLFSSAIKVISVFILFVPLVTNFEERINLEKGLKAMESDPVYLKSVGLQGISQPIYPQFVDAEIQLKTVEWYQKTHDEIVQLIDNERLSFIDMDTYHFNYYLDETSNVSPYAIVNDIHLSYYPITKNKKPFDMSQENHNFILVPKSKKDKFENQKSEVEGFENKNVHYVDNTFTQFSNYPGHNNQYQDPILYVIVDDYSYVPEFYNSLRKVINDESDYESFNKTMFEFNQEVAQFPRIKSEDIHELISNEAQEKNTIFYTMLLISIFVIALFTHLSTYSYLEITKKETAVKYIHGHSGFNRYSLIYMINMISIMILSYLLYRYNNSLIISNKEYLLIGKNYIILALLAMFIGDLIITSILIYIFQKRNIVTLLKGEEN